MHYLTSLVAIVLVCAILALVLFAVRWGIYRARERRYAARVHRADELLKDTELLLRVGNDPSAVRELKCEMADKFGYEGSIDGIPDAEMISILARHMEGLGIDLGEHVRARTPLPRHVGALPEEVSEKIALEKAMTVLEVGTQIPLVPGTGRIVA